MKATRIMWAMAAWVLMTGFTTAAQAKVDADAPITVANWEVCDAAGCWWTGTL
ncbi:hypothetical protein K788_00000005 [Paraburkholderia caribensis MBA4]|uniref:Uncharacterized protein n=1 Tax=Paraburkholderia caribensis MBA4 TaxID=1323664 RepID=A0A0P0RJN4_9BURK|nr:hypothetical protein K788_00000005 [Paraburkholderia caribensis MBA4]